MTENNRTQHDSVRRPGPACRFVVRSDDDHLPEAAPQHVESPPASPTGSDRLVLTVDEAAYLLNISRGWPASSWLGVSFRRSGWGGGS